MSAIDNLKANLKSWVKQPMKLGGDGAQKALVSLADVLGQSIISYKYGDVGASGYPEEQGDPGQLFIANDGSCSWVWIPEAAAWAPIMGGPTGGGGPDIGGDVTAPRLPLYEIPQDVLDLIGAIKATAEAASATSEQNKTSIADIKNSSKLTPSHKPLYLSLYRDIVAEHDWIVTQSDTYLIDPQRYKTAVADLKNQMGVLGLRLNTDEENWLTFTTDTDVANLRKLFNKVATERKSILDNIAAQSSTLVQGILAAAAANLVVNDMGNDNVLTPAEKYSVFNTFKGYYTTRDDNVIRAQGFGIPYTDYTTAIDNLTDYMAGIGLPLTDRSNVALWSEDYTQPEWVKTVTITPNAIAGPQPGSFADRITATAVDQSMYQTVSVQSGYAYTVSFYTNRIPDPFPADPNDLTTVIEPRIQLLSVWDVQNAQNLVNPTAYSIRDNEWVRAEVSFFVPEGCTSVRLNIVDPSSSVPDFYMWGVQVELHESATPYLQTGSVPTTVRDAENNAPQWLSYSSNIVGTEFRAIFENAARESGKLYTALAEKARTVAQDAIDAVDAAKGTYDTLSQRLEAINNLANDALTLTGTNLEGKTAWELFTGKADVDFTNVGDGSVAARLIAAGAVTTGKLTVTNFDNLVPNPNGEYVIPTPPQGSPEEAAVVVAASETPAITGGNAKIRKLTTINGAVNAIITNEIPAQSGDKFYFECQAIGNGANARMGIRFTLTTGGPTYSISPSQTGTTWGSTSANVTCPANTKSVAFYIEAGHTASGTKCYFDKFYARRMADGKLIVDGSIIASKLSIVPAAQSLTFDPACSDVTAWNADAGGTFSIVTLTDGKIGNTAIRSNATGVTSWVYSKPVPFDPTKTYRIKGTARHAGANGRFYLAVRLLDAAGANITGDGTWWYYPINNLPTGTDPTVSITTSFADYIGLFGGAGKTTPARKFPANARQMCAGAVLNHGGTAGYMEIQDLRIDEVANGTLIEDNAITTGKIGAEAVTTDKIIAGGVTAKHLTITNFDNLFPNPTSEVAPPTGWVDPGGLVANGVTVNNGIRTDPEFQFIADATATDGTGYNAGNKVRKLVGGASANSVLGIQIPILAGDQFYIETMARKTAGTGNSGVYYFIYNATGGTVAQGGFGPAGSTWGKVSGTIKIPLVGDGTGGTVTEANRPNKLFVYLYADANTTAEFDAMYLQRKNDAKLVVDGSITATAIASQTITTDKMLVKASFGAALNPDPNCLDITAWHDNGNWNTPTTHATVVNIGAEGVSGTLALHTDGTDSTIFSDPIPVNVNKQYRASMLVRAIGTTTPAGNVYLTVACYTADGTNIAHPSGGIFWWYPQMGTPTTSFARWGSTYRFGGGTIPPQTASSNYFPEGTSYVRVGFLDRLTNGAIEVQDLRIEEAIPGDLIVDGGITANKLTFAPVVSDNNTSGTPVAVIEAINDANESGLKISASKVTIGGATTFESGYNPNTLNGDLIYALNGGRDRTTTEIDGGKITTGYVNANRIAANSITTDKMVVTGSNLVPNSDFATGDLTGWRPQSNPASQSVILSSNAAVPTGGTSRYVARHNHAVAGTISTFTHTKAYADVGADKDGFAVTANEVYRVSVDAVKSASAAFSTLQVMAFFHKVDGTYTTSATPINLLTATPAIDSTWRTFTGTFTVPANALRCHLYVYGTSTATGDLFWTNLRCFRMASGELIVDGAVTANKLNFVPVYSDNNPSGTPVAVIEAINDANESGLKISASKITISGATTFESGYDPTTIGGANIVLNSGFDKNIDASTNVADGWGLYSNSPDNGTTNPNPVLTVQSGGLYGGLFQRVTWAYSNLSTKGVTGNVVKGGWRDNVWYVVSFYAKASAGVQGRGMYLGWNNGPQTSVEISNPNLTADWQRYAFRIKWNAGAARPGSPNGTLWISIVGTGASGDLDLDCVQVEEGQVPTPWAPCSEDAQATADQAKTNADQALTKNGDLIYALNGGRDRTTTEIDGGKITTGYINASRIDAGTITGTHLSGDALATSDWLETNGVPVRGVKLLSILSATYWWYSTAYAVGDIRRRNGNAYRCVQAGTSAASGTGPTGYGTGIVDGTCKWDYYAQLRIGAGGAVIGKYSLDEVTLRTISGLRLSGDRVWYVGSRSTRAVNDGSPVMMDSRWAAGRRYYIGDHVLGSNGYVFKCVGFFNTTDSTLGSVSGATEPTWPTTGTVTDTNNDILWQTVAIMGNCERVNINNWGFHAAVGGGFYRYHLRVAIRPVTSFDNLDALRHIKIDLYNNTGTYVDTAYGTLPDRAYITPDTDYTSNNTVVTDISWLGPLCTTYASGYLDAYLKVEVVNASGKSVTRYYHTVNSGTASATGGVTIPNQAAAPTPPPPSDGSDTYGSCPAPETLILLGDGASTKAAGDLAVGDTVWTMHERTLEWGEHKVTSVELFESERLAVNFHDGRVLIASPDHRVYSMGDWRHIKDLIPNFMVEGTEPARVISVEPAQPGTVVKITVDNAHTYISAGLLSHNLKKLTP